uniref:Uncharacterized protein n=1 Tax=Lepeophtheirus salmonis TaxID=72036 RepID=A0A0K2SVS9_LEPSM
MNTIDEKYPAVLWNNAAIHT